jgi:hypothetical protein
MISYVTCVVGLLKSIFTSTHPQCSPFNTLCIFNQMLYGNKLISSYNQMMLLQFFRIFLSYVKIYLSVNAGRQTATSVATAGEFRTRKYFQKIWKCFVFFPSFYNKTDFFKKFKRKLDPLSRLYKVTSC